MSYNIKLHDADGINYTMLSFALALNESLAELDNAIMELIELDSFEGDAAQAIKSYYEENHRPCLAMMQQIAETLQAEYVTHYLGRFRESPIEESHSDAGYPEADMQTLENGLYNLKINSATQAQDWVERSIAALPDNISFTRPSNILIIQGLEESQAYTEKLRTGVYELENHATEIFCRSSSTGKASALMDALTLYILGLTNMRISPETYKTGSTSSLFTSLELRDLYDNCSNFNKESADIVQGCTEESLDRYSVYIDKIEKAAIEEKKKACLFGTAASVGLFTLSALSLIALVATAGAATPALALWFGFASSTLGLYSSGKDMSERSRQLISVMNGDAQAEKKDMRGRSNETSKAGKDATKVTRKGLEGARKTAVVADDYNKYADKRYKDYTLKDSFLDHRTNNLCPKPTVEKEIDEHLDDLGNWASDSVADFTMDKVKDASCDLIASATNEETAAWVEGAWEFRESIEDGIFEGDWDAMNLAKATCKAAESVSDYYAEQADEKLDFASTTRDGIEEQKQALDEKSSHEWSTNW